jgi:hypothetical protein
MSTAIVGGLHFDVLEVPTVVGSLIFDAKVGKLYVPIEHRQGMRIGPVTDLFWCPGWSTVTVGTISIAFLQKPLILALQLVIQADAGHTSTSIHDSFGGAQVSSVNVGVVCEFPGPYRTRIEVLPWLMIGTSMLVQERPPLSGQSDDGGTIGTHHWRHHLDEAGTAKLIHVASIGSRHTQSGIEITKCDDPEGADCSQRSALRAAQFVVVSAKMYVLTLATAGEIQPSCERIPWIALNSSISGVEVDATAAARVGTIDIESWGPLRLTVVEASIPINVMLHRRTSWR